MLTNNKKSYFVKSIAMIMAVLMVLAVALTGCGNKAAEEAATKAENAQTTANEAKTAAQAVADALKDYLKITEGVKADAIDAIIKDALDKFGNDLSEAATYVKNDEAFKALTDKVATVYVKSEVDAAIAAAVAGKITAAEAQALVDALGTTVAEDIAEAVAGLAKTADLGVYFKSAEWDAKFEASFSTALTAAKAQFPYLTEDDLAGIKSSVQNVYTKAEVDTKVNGLKTEITNTLANYYTKVQVDALLATYTKADQDLAAADTTMAAQIAQLQEIVYQILSAFLPKEEVETLTNENVDFGELLEKWDATTIAGAIADKWSLEEWNTTTPKVIAAIAGIQTLVDNLYDEVEVGGVKVAKNAYTKANKTAINNALAPLNIAIFKADGTLESKTVVTQTLEYSFLRVANGGDLETMYAAVEAAKAVPTFAQELKTVVDTIFAVGHKHDNKQFVNIEDVANFNTFTFAYDAVISKYRIDNAFAGTQYEGTYGALAINTVWEHPTDATKIVVAADNATEYKTGAGTETDPTVVWKKYEAQPITLLIGTAGDAWKKADDNGVVTLPTLTTVFDWTKADITEEVTGLTVHGGTVTLAKTATEATNVYAALYAQFGECFTAINTAKTTFKNFLANTVKEHGVLSNGTALKGETTVTAAQYLEALTVEMCLAVEEGLVVNLYLSTNVANAMNALVARNTCAANAAPSAAVVAVFNNNGTTTDDYKLYNDMMDKVAGKLFELYQDYAQEMLQKIVEDYLSVLEAAKAMASFESTVTLAGDFNVATDFLKAFFNGTAFTGWASNSDPAYAEGALNVKKDTFNVLKNYYANNTDTNDYNANPVYTIQQNIEQLTLYLKASVIGVRDSINTLTLEAAMAEDATKYPKATAYKIFEDRLDSAVANLDEVYARFLYEDFVNVQITGVVNYATTTANLFSKGYKTTDEIAKLVAAMEAYLVGTTEGDSTLFPNNGLANGSLLKDLKGELYQVNTHTGITSVLDITKVAAAAETAVKALIATYETMLDNMAIKYNFLQYLEEATLNLQEAYVTYRSIKGVRLALNNQVDAAYNVADTDITMKKFQEQYNVIAIDEYVDYYTDVLTLIFDTKKDEKVEHVKHLFNVADDPTTTTDETYDHVTEQWKKVLSKTDKTWVGAAGTANYVKRPYDTTAEYKFLGTIITGYTKDDNTKVKGFDEIVNADTKFVDGETTKNLY